MSNPNDNDVTGGLVEMASRLPSVLLPRLQATAAEHGLELSELDSGRWELSDPVSGGRWVARDVPALAYLVRERVWEIARGEQQ